MSKSPRLPSPDNRTIIIGSTGTGKTQWAVYLLSSRDFHARPWIIFDFKRDKLIAALGATEVSLDNAPPTNPGLYVVRPDPFANNEAALTLYFKRIWANENTGVYVDEGYEIGNRNLAFRALLTQGRSKQIEMIILSQRPVWMDKFVFSEASFFAVFNLTIADDRAYVRTYLGGDVVPQLPRFSPYWFDVEKQKGVILEPAPSADKILALFRRRLTPAVLMSETKRVEPTSRIGRI